MGTEAGLCPRPSLTLNCTRVGQRRTVARGTMGLREGGGVMSQEDAWLFSTLLIKLKQARQPHKPHGHACMCVCAHVGSDSWAPPPPRHGICVRRLQRKGWPTQPRPESPGAGEVGAGRS